MRGVGLKVGEGAIKKRSRRRGVNTCDGRRQAAGGCWGRQPKGLSRSRG